MIDVVKIKFEDDNKTYYFSLDCLELTFYDKVVVETDMGKKLGEVVGLESINKKDIDYSLGKILSIASSRDLENYEKNKKEALLALKKCKELVNKMDLKMNLVSCFYTLDKKQLLFYFVADERIDFRALVKELAAIYRTRIELRQIGIRDKALQTGGIGPCGRMLCCSSFLYDFESVSINMAKNQNLSLNPNKINGQCGRLLCCLNYEDEQYLEYRKGMPEIGDVVVVEEKEGRVVSIDIMARKYKAIFDNDEIIEVELKALNNNVEV